MTRPILFRDIYRSYYEEITNILVYKEGLK